MGKVSDLLLRLKIEKNDQAAQTKLSGPVVDAKKLPAALQQDDDDDDDYYKEETPE